MQYLIGVDIGTQSTRAAVMEESGRILTQASKETELIYEGDRWVWQEPDRMYGDAVETVKAAVEKARIAPSRWRLFVWTRKWRALWESGKREKRLRPMTAGWINGARIAGRSFGPLARMKLFLLRERRDLCSWAENSLVEKASSGDLSED